MALATLSVIVITKNESERIDACLASVDFADEWIVVDAASSDDTAERARRRGATVVVSADWPGFGAQKQRALNLATSTWVLSLDADEQVSSDLAASIRSILQGDPAAPPPGYELDRLSQMSGRWIRHGDWYPDRVLRLFRRDQGRFSADRVHERVLVDGPVGRLAGHLLHFTMPTFADALDKINRYSSDGAADRVAAGGRGGLAAAIGHAAWAFARSYVVRRGFLDGAAGFIVAVYIAEGTWWRYLKMAELARHLPRDGRPDGDGH